MEAPKICNLRHPQYTANFENWLKWRLTYLGGPQFLRKYLKKYSKREDDQDYRDRRSVSYVPAFSKAAVNDVKNAIFERLSDVSRVGGPPSYEDCVSGLNGGVDLKGSSMNSFVGRELLPELLSMSRVGVYVDMPPLPGPTVADKQGKRPYLYWYKTEDILCWADRDDFTREFKAVLLLDTVPSYNIQYALPTGTVDRYRYVWIDDEDGLVHIKFFNHQGVPCDEEGEIVSEDAEIILKLRKIPFVLFQLSDSLLADVADYQISLLNLASSDMGYSLKANFPFYTEQVDWRASSPYLKTQPPGQKTTTQTSFDGSTAIVNQEQVKEIRTGVSTGRQYGIGAERPAFIHPSSEPLQISMAKQEQLKLEIRELISLTLSTLASSAQDTEKGLDAGLSSIGFELEHGERKIAEIWAMYEGSDQIATVGYPENYQLISEEDRRNQTDHYTKLLPVLNSLTYQKEIAKRIADISLGNKVSTAKLKQIKSEIDKAKVIVSDPDVIKTDLEAGLVSVDLASKTRGYPEGEVEQAKKDHAERIERIAAAQAPGLGAGQARGVADLGANPKAGREEKAQSRDTTKDPVATDKTRGAGQ